MYTNLCTVIVTSRRGDVNVSKYTRGEVVLYALVVVLAVVLGLLLGGYFHSTTYVCPEPDGIDRIVYDRPAK